MHTYSHTHTYLLVWAGSKVLLPNETLCDLTPEMSTVLMYGNRKTCALVKSIPIQCMTTWRLVHSLNKFWSNVLMDDNRKKDLRTH